MKIKTLNQDTINKIAAGEVILRPSSVVKELVENSIDAGATHIEVRVQDGGKKEIVIVDDGCGIAYDEIPLAFKRHATSKINFLSDLDELETMGFRGEALSSIAAVATVEVTSKTEEEELGSKTVYENGEMKSRTVFPYEKGTEFVVSDLFKNVPARFKFLKKDTSEEKHVRDIISKLALSHPNIAFTYISDGKKKFQTLGNGDLKEAARGIFGSSFGSHLHEFEQENLPMRVYGLMGDLDARRTHRDNQIFFINGRYVKSKMLTDGLEEEWLGRLMKHQHPSGVIFLELPQRMLDVNVHPQKTEIRILNKSLVSILFKQCIRNALSELDIIPEIIEDEEDDGEYAQFTYTGEEDEEEEEQTQETFQDHILKNLPIANAPKRHKEGNGEDGGDVLPAPEAAQQTLSSQEVKEEGSERFSVSEAVLEALRPKEKLDLPSMNLVGQVFNTYIILESGDSLYIVDQHAAHEAILYETFRKAFESGTGFESQGMLIPAVVSLSNEEMEDYPKVEAYLKKLGFKSQLKDGALEVMAVPMILDTVQPPELIVPLISWLSGKSDNSPELGLARIATLSCKAAVKAGDVLDTTEIETLLYRLSKLDNPYTCPHGRPIIRKRTEYEMEKLFKRIV